MARTDAPAQRCVVLLTTAAALALITASFWPRNADASGQEAPPAGIDVIISGQDETGRLVPGTLAEVRWGALPAAVDELELLLSVDGGSTFPIRLTPQLEGGRRSFRWVVPNLPTLHARLRLRVGSRGAESDGAESAGFTIAARRKCPAASLRFASGEWWQTAGVPSGPAELNRRSERVAASVAATRALRAALARTYRPSSMASHRFEEETAVLVVPDRIAEHPSQVEPRPLAAPQRE